MNLVFPLLQIISEHLDSIPCITNQHKFPFYIRAIRACNLINYKLEDMSKIQHYFVSPWFDITSFARIDLCGFSSKLVVVMLLTYILLT